MLHLNCKVTFKMLYHGTMEIFALFKFVTKISYQVRSLPVDLRFMLNTVFAKKIIVAIEAQDYFLYSAFPVNYILTYAIFLI